MSVGITSKRVDVTPLTEQTEACEKDKTKIYTKNTAEKAGVLKEPVQVEVKKAPSASTEKAGDKQVRVLVPTQSEAWTKVELWSYQKVVLIGLRATLLRPFLERTIKNFNEKTWQKIQDISIWGIATCGDIEKAALTIINGSEKPIDSRKETHDNLKKLLKTYAEKGYKGLIEAMNAIKNDDATIPK